MEVVVEKASLTPHAAVKAPNKCSPRRIFLSITCLSIVVVAVICGVVFGLGLNLPIIHIRVSSLQSSSSATASGRRNLDGSTLFNFTAPRAPYSTFTHLDGLQLNVALVRVAITEQHVVSIADWSTPSVPLLINPSLKTVNLDISAHVAFGDYIEADFIFWNRYSIKAYCTTRDYLVYTSASGVKTVNISTFQNSPFALPSDYDYTSLENTDYSLQGDFFTGDWKKAMDAKDWTFINSDYNFTLGPNSRLDILVDGSYTVACYDGSAPTNSNNYLLPPFNNNQINSAPATSQPAGIDFGAWQLPVFISVSDLSSPVPTGETYAFALTVASLPASHSLPAADWSKVAIISIAWSGSNQLIDIRPRQNNILSGSGFNYHLDASSNSWSFSVGGQFYMSYSLHDAIRITGFTRATVADQVYNLTMTPGPDCQNQGGFNCQGPPITLFYLLVDRV